MASEVMTESLSAGRRVWLWTAIVISVLVLILASGSVVGVWVGQNGSTSAALRQ